MRDPIVILFLVVLAVEIVLAIGAAWAMRLRYGRRLVRSLLWDRLIASEVRTVLAGLVIGVELTHSILQYPLHLPPLPQPTAIVIFLCALMLLFWGPIADLQTMRAIERDAFRPPA